MLPTVVSESTNAKKATIEGMGRENSDITMGDLNEGLHKVILSLTLKTCPRQNILF